MILTATPAVSILVSYNNKVLLKRGILKDSENNFTPGTLVNRAIESNKTISIASTKFFPDICELEFLSAGLPSALILPLQKKGFIIIGGSSERCFTSSDDKWIQGWAEKIYETINS